MQRTRRRKNQKVSTALKGFASAGTKDKIDLLRDIKLHVTAENARSGNDHRSKDKIHVSEIVKGACPRMLFYKVSGEEPTDVIPGAWAGLVAMWAAGSAEHEKWQNWLREMGDLFGTWHCLACEHDWEDTSPPACPKCGSGLLRYDEVNLFNDDLSLTGHADGAVPRLRALVEIKSFAAGSVRIENPGLVAEHTLKVEGKSIIDHDALWRSIKRPLLSHMIQGLFYLWLCREMGLPYDRIIFIYESKTTQATKAFEITLTERRLQPFIDTLTEIRDAVQTGVVLPRPKLYTKDAKPCTECPFRTKCYEETDADPRTESPAVPPRRPRARSEATGGEAEVRPSRPTRGVTPGRARRPERPVRRGRRADDDVVDEVGGAPERATGPRGGGRAVVGSADGAGEGPRFARRNREGRDPD